MTERSCDEIRELAPEVALGVATGEERAVVLQHIARCARCRREIDEFAQIADRLLILAPGQEPPGGFESRVLAQMQTVRPVRKRRRLPSLAAVALVAAAVGAAFVFFALSEERRLAESYRRALTAANGEYFGVVQLRDPDRTDMGHVFAYQGEPSWIFMTIRGRVTPGRYDVEVVTDSGQSLSSGSFDIDGPRSWGSELPLELHDVAVIRLVPAEGGEVLAARFP